MNNVVDLCSADDSFEWSPVKKTPGSIRKRTAFTDENLEHVNVLHNEALKTKKRKGQTPIDLTLSDRKDNEMIDRSIISVHSSQSSEKRIPLQPVFSPDRTGVACESQTAVVELLDSPLQTLLDASSRYDGFSQESLSVEQDSGGTAARSPVPKPSTSRAQDGPNKSLFERLLAAKPTEYTMGTDACVRLAQSDASVELQHLEPPLPCAFTACDSAVVEIHQSLSTTSESVEVDSAEEGAVSVARGSADDFEVRLLVDRRERANNLVLASLQTLGVRCEAANLAVGDFLFIARRRTHGLYEATESTTVAADTLVLDHVVVERKAVADLAASLLDGRFSDQKRRLKMTRIQRCIVVVEGESMLLPPQMQRVLTAQHLKTAMVNAYADHDVHIVRTRNMDHSIAFLRTLFRQVSHYFAEQLRPTSVLAPAVSFMSLRRFQELYRARSADNLSELFGQQLRQIHGCGASAAHAIVSRYGTLAHFVWHMRSIGRLNAQVS